MNQLSKDLETRLSSLTDELLKTKRGSEEAEKILKEIEKISNIIREEDTHKKKRYFWLNDYVRFGIDVLAIAAPLAFYGVWMKRGLEFEQTGAITSWVNKGLFSKFKA